MNYVEQITNSMLAEVQTALGVDYKELCYFYDISENSYFGNVKRFGVVPTAASSATTPTKAYTLDHTFQVIITDSFENVGETDEKQRQIVNELYDKVDEVTNRLYAKKVGLPSIVFFVTLDSMEEPEFIAEDNVAAIRANYIVKYRRNL